LKDKIIKKNLSKEKKYKSNLKEKKIMEGEIEKN
jgi:hypothetical protein